MLLFPAPINGDSGSFMFIIPLPARQQLAMLKIVLPLPSLPKFAEPLQDASGQVAAALQRSLLRSDRCVHAAITLSLSE